MTTLISDNWEGWFINQLLPEDHPNYLFPHTKPVNVDWKTDLKENLYLESDSPVMLKHLWAGKIFYLYNNPESEANEELETRVPIVVIKYDYGEFKGLLPQKQDLVLCGFYREELGSPIELKPYQRIRNNFKKTGAKSNLVENRRKTAVNYLKERAFEIDELVQTLINGYGEAAVTEMGIKVYDLENKVVDFFSDTDIALKMLQYINSGSLGINSYIQQLMEDNDSNHWLNISIPVAQLSPGKFYFITTGYILQSIFAEAVTEINQGEIDTKINSSI